MILEPDDDNKPIWTVEYGIGTWDFGDDWATKVARVKAIAAAIEIYRAIEHQQGDLPDE